MVGVPAPCYSRVDQAARGGISMRVRPVYEMEDFAASDPTGELRKQEERLRQTVEAKRR